ncbi:MAG: prenyltransferase [Anaerolineales bacterium]|nr:prenyltransferase [Anaerolineales bacterium]
MNFAMWKKALQVIPSVTKEEWDALDIVSKWLIASRAAVLVMTFISAALAGIFALRDGEFRLLPWLGLALGLVFSHAANNLLNDYTDFVRGVDEDNYFRTQYGPQPLAAGLLTRGQLLTYAGITGAIALAFGVALMAANSWDLNILWLLGAGAFFVLFYTWPLKYIAMGEIAVLLVWGPLMIGGGYYVLAQSWDWFVVWASLPYVLGVTTVIFGKHIDKIEVDRAKHIHTLPVLLGEKLSRFAVLGMMALSYLIVIALIVMKYFTPVMLVVLLALPTFKQVIPALLKPKPAERPEDFPAGEGGWPLYFAPISFINNRSFGGYFMLGLLADTLLRIFLPSFWI